MFTLVSWNGTRPEAGENIFLFSEINKIMRIIMTLKNVCF